jgi:hypothetical protein
MRTISKTLMPRAVTPVALLALLTLSASAHANPQRAQLQANFQAADVDKNEQLNVAEWASPSFPDGLLSPLSLAQSQLG